jgi:deaminated glutathione amidase
MTELRVCSIQMVSTALLQDNLDRAAHWVEKAAESGAKLVLLPEYFCLMGLADTDKVRVREAPGAGPIQAHLASLAKKHALYLVAGTIPLECSDPSKVLNTTLVFDPNGLQIARYDKMHLFGFQTKDERYQESETITPGQQPGSVTLSIGGVEWRFGLSICYDLRFPELYRAMGLVDCHLIPAAFTYTTGKDHWEILLRARAIENQSYVLASAQGGVHQNQRRTWGNSMLVDPWGHVLERIAEGEGLITGVLSKDTLNAVRSKLPALQHRTM